MASETELTQPFKQAMDKLQQGYDLAKKKFEELVNKINDQWWMLVSAAGAAFLWWLKDKLGKLRDALERLGKKIKEIVEHHTPVVSLIIASFRWLDKVHSPISELSSKTVAPKDQNMYKWTGDAALAYRTKATAQQGAVDDATKKAEFISGWLMKVAKSNVDTSVELAKKVAEFADSIVALVTKAATIIGLAEAAGELGDLAGDAVEKMINFVIEAAKALVNTLGNVRDLWASAGDHSKLPGGKWPEAVTG